MANDYGKMTKDQGSMAKDQGPMCRLRAVQGGLVKGL
jgi:hypothetical protein